jgi:hypothetical protein
MIRRIHWHWTAGAEGIHDIERDSYNYVILHDGTVVHGDWPPEAQFPPLKPGKYAAHTLNANSHAIGIALDGMVGSQERPFARGTAEINMKQVDELVRLTADLCLKWDVPVTRENVLSHAEVERNIGIKQRPKWDIMWLPDMPAPGDAVAVGDRLRRMVQMELNKRALARVRPAPQPVAPAPVDHVPVPPARPVPLWQRVLRAVRR